ncbi:MAG: phycobiliprotein lyase [Cyanobacteriota bacterium]
MTAFPPQDLCGFLQLSAGDWLTLRSLLDTDTKGQMEGSPELAAETVGTHQAWHQADRGDLKVRFLEATQLEDWGSLEIAPPDQPCLTLIFRRDGSVLINRLKGRWQLGADGSLELEVKEETRIVKERIWFSKPNLRLRCTLEQFLDGQPGRASFCSEIRRVSRAPETTEKVSDG